MRLRGLAARVGERPAMDGGAGALSSDSGCARDGKGAPSMFSRMPFCASAQWWFGNVEQEVAPLCGLVRRQAKPSCLLPLTAPEARPHPSRAREAHRSASVRLADGNFCTIIDRSAAGSGRS